MMRALALGLMLFAVEAHADPDQVPPQVALAIVGDAANADAVGKRITSWFRGQSTTVWTTELEALDPASVLAPVDHPGVQVWIVLTDPHSAKVFFAVQEKSAQTPRYLVTDIPFDSGLDELAIERLAQVVYPSALALWAGNVESSRADVEAELRHQPGDGPAPISPPLFLQPPPPDPRVLGFRIGSEYAATFDGDAGVAQKLGATASALWRRDDTTFGTRFHLGVLLPHDTTVSGVELDLEGASTGLGATYERKVSKHASIPAEVGFGLDVVRYRTGMLANPIFLPTAGGYDVQPLAFARTGVHLELGGLSVGIEAILDVQLRHTHYDVSEGGAQMPVVVPWLVQPGVAANVIW